MHYNATSKVRVELSYLYALERLGVKPGLGVMQKMMEALGHPERQFKSIHVTGTNGKGSTCAMLESILRQVRLRSGDAKKIASRQNSDGQEGYNVGLYTSPHLYAFNERIQINRVSISDEELAALVCEIREVCEREHIEPTFFEFTTALAFLYFARAHIDIAVIEVGMGGLYDATNVVTPLVSVITNIGLDHTEYFGPTKAHVAREKAGIIKEGVSVVTYEGDQEMLNIFDDEARKKHTSVIRAYDIVQTTVISSGLDGQIVEVKFPSSYLTHVSPFNVHLPLLGSHQVANMATAIAALVVWERGTITPEAIVSGIKNTKWEGRLQVISRQPLIMIDGAHNGDGAKALAEFLEHVQGRDVLVFAAKKGKDISDMLTYVIPLFTHIIVTEGSFMPERAEEIAGLMQASEKAITIEKDPARAFELGRSLINNDGTMLITGSLYMIADVLAHIRRYRV